MSVSEFESFRLLLTSVVIIALMWIVWDRISRALRHFRAHSKSRVPFPRFARRLIVSVTSMIAIAKPVHATQSPSSSTELPIGEGSSSGGGSLLLAGSLAANGLLCAAQVRKALAKLRTRRFGVESSDGETKVSHEVMPLSTSHDWRVMVRVLGPPAVESRYGQRIEFGKGKARELLVWMCEHRETSTRSAARTALWDIDVQDATFSNVVSEVRRGLNASVPLDEEEWIPRTFSDDLPLNTAVVTDAEVLHELTSDFLRDPNSHLDALATAVSEVRNLPFSGANYAWADGEGITTSHVIKVVRAAVLLAEHAIEEDDTNLLFMATERGLRVLPGHEELVSLRMRGHARTGNRSAIKYEWESYARAIEADSWAGAAPSRELEQLACELSRS